MRTALFAIAAGIASAVGLGCFYRALAKGHLGTVAAISASGAVIPVMVGVVGGEAISLIGAIGIVGTVGGVVLATQTPSGTAVSARDADRTSLAYAVIAAVCFGTYFCLFSEASRGGVAAASLIEGAVSVACLGTAWAVLNGTTPRSNRDAAGRAIKPSAVLVTVGSGLLNTAKKNVPLMITATGIAASGLLDLGASTLFAHASMAGRLGITSTLGGLHPVVTILLSRIVLDERPGNVQTIGVVLAIAGTVLATM